MKRISKHLMGIDQGDLLLFSDYENDGPMWSNTGPRELRKFVRFSQEFSSPPIVQIGLSMLDIGNENNFRYDLTTDHIQPNGFQVVFKTWGDTKIARARAAWIAMGELDHEEDWKVD